MLSTISLTRTQPASACLLSGCQPAKWRSAALHPLSRGDFSLLSWGLTSLKQYSLEERRQPLVSVWSVSPPDSYVNRNLSWTNIGWELMKVCRLLQLDIKAHLNNIQAGMFPEEIAVKFFIWLASCSEFVFTWSLTANWRISQTAERKRPVKGMLHPWNSCSASLC